MIEVICDPVLDGSSTKYYMFWASFLNFLPIWHNTFASFSITCIIFTWWKVTFTIQFFIAEKCLICSHWCIIPKRRSLIWHETFSSLFSACLIFAFPTSSHTSTIQFFITIKWTRKSDWIDQRLRTQTYRAKTFK